MEMVRSGRGNEDEKMSRTPNSTCQCGKTTYRRPHEIKTAGAYICSSCRASRPKSCLQCGEDFFAEHKRRKYCSRDCSNRGRRGISYSKDSHGNKSAQRLNLLSETFNFDECMVSGCTYNKVYEIHRHIPGSSGGKYEIGNMFAICPNHHAEITRRVAKSRKINDFTLEVSYST